MNTYEKILLTSLGLIGASADEAKKAFQIIGKKSQKKELSKTLNALIKRGRLEQKTAEAKARQLVKKVLKELDIPTRSELKALEKKLGRQTKK